MLYDAGRMHPHLLALPDGELVMTVTARHDIRDGRLAGYRRCCDAIISHDNGLTWDPERTFVLDEWKFFDPRDWAFGQCGHIYLTLLDDGRILTVHNNYLPSAFIRNSPAKSGTGIILQQDLRVPITGHYTL